MRTARRASSRLSALSDTTTSAAAPSLIGAHIERVMGQATSLSASTSSTVMGVRYCASGLNCECQWFLAATAAIWRCVVPKVFM